MNIKESLFDFIKKHCTPASVPREREWENVTLKDDVLTLDFRDLAGHITLKNGSKQLGVMLYIAAYALSFTYNVKIHLLSQTVNFEYDPINELNDFPSSLHRLMQELTAVFSVMNDVEGFSIVLSKVNKEAITPIIDSLLQIAEDFGGIEIKAMLMRYTNKNGEAISL